MDKIHVGCLVKCIMESTYIDAPKTTIGEIHTVTAHEKNNWIRLKGTNPPIDDFRFAIKRFEFYQDDGKTYPTINEKYFDV